MAFLTETGVARLWSNILAYTQLAIQSFDFSTNSSFIDLTDRTSAIQQNKVNRAGDTMTGKLKIQEDLYSGIELKNNQNNYLSVLQGSYVGATSIGAYSNGTNQRRMLEVRNKRSSNSLDKAVVLRDAIDGKLTDYKVWHEMNSIAVSWVQGNPVQFNSYQGYGIMPKVYIEAQQNSGEDPSPNNIVPISGKEEIELALMNERDETIYSSTVSLPEISYGGYIDWARKKYVQTYCGIILTGTESIMSFTSLGTNCRAMIFIDKAGKAGTTQKSICSHLKMSYDTSDHTHFYVENNDLWLFIPQSSSAAVKSYLAAQYSAGTPVTVVYELAEPIEYDLPDLPRLQAVDGLNVVRVYDAKSVYVSYNHDPMATGSGGGGSTQQGNYFIIKDKVNGANYILEISDGVLMTSCKIDASQGIYVRVPPTYMDNYIIGQAFDPFGMVVSATTEDGNYKDLQNYTYTETIPANGKIIITYEECGKTFTTELIVGTSSASTLLQDYNYTQAGSNVEITGWKGTENGVSTTSLNMPEVGVQI